MMYQAKPSGVVVRNGWDLTTCLSRREVSPCKVTRGDKTYTIPPEMISDKGALKEGVKKIVDGYFAAVAAGAR